MFFIIFFVVSASFACSGSITFPVAAVSDDGRGMLMDLTVSASPGNGNVFIGVPPYSGVDLQRSAVDAVTYSDTRSCDISVRLGNIYETNYVDGPSAGAAISAMTYILVNNLSVANPSVITGAVDSSGRVLPVGGVYEKALASAKNRSLFFISPKADIYEHIMLKKIEEKYPLKIIFAGSVSEIIDFLVNNETPVAPDYPQFESAGKNIVAYEPAKDGSAKNKAAGAKSMQDFSSVAGDILYLENYSIIGLGNNHAEDWLIAYFRNSTDENSRILSLGYPYTAANNAFLDYINMNTILFVYSGKPSTKDKLAEIQNCLKQVRSTEMTSDNFEWIIGSDLRKAWAEEKLNSSVLAKDHLAEEEYGYYHDIMYADAWCNAANSLSKLASHSNSINSGNKIEQNKWANIALGYLTEANKTEHTSERQSRMNSARASFNNGKYGAAIFDAVYVLSMDRADIEMANMTEDELINRTSSMLANGFSSVWASVYASQAAYLVNKDIPDYKPAYPLVRFASALDEAVSEMNAASAAGENKNEAAAADMIQISYLKLFAILLATFILLFVVFFFIILPRIRKRMPNERKDSKINRTDRRARERVS